MNRRRFLTSAAAAVTAARIRPARAAREVLVAEPVHSTGYLPLYIAMAKGYFADVMVRLVTIENGSGHANAVLSGQAFAFIGGPEHNAFAKAKGAELRAVANCVNRGNVYYCAAPGYEPTDRDWTAFFKKWRNSCGEDAWVALKHIRALIEKAREKGVPVIYTTGVRRGDLWDSGSWAWKNNRNAEDVTNKTVTSNFDGNEIVAEIAPGPRDIVVYKQKPSGFFGTNLTSYLTLLGCDSLIVTGTTTSGCVRASVIDAFSLNYRITIAEEGCFDRSQASHAINLCDMNAKYADVVKTAEVLTFFDTLPAGMFDLPKGVATPEPHPMRRAARY